MHINLLYNGEFDSKDIPDRFDEDQHTLNDIDMKLRLATFREILHGPRNAQADVEAILKRLSEFYQPKIKEIESLIKIFERKSGVSKSRLFLFSLDQAARMLISLGKDIQQRLEMQPRKHPGAEEPELYCYIQQALNFMLFVDERKQNIIALIGGVLERARKTIK